MNKKINYTKTLGTFMFILIVSAQSIEKSKADDFKGQIFGYGLISCQDYRKSVRTDTKKTSWDAEYAKAWTDGFLTATDVAVTFFGKQLRTSEGKNQNLNEFMIRDRLWDDLNDYCKANLKHDFIEAINNYVEKWYPENIIETLPETKPQVYMPHLGTGARTCKEYTRSLKRPGHYFETDIFLFIDQAGAIETWLQGYVSSVSITMKPLMGIAPRELKPLDSIQKLKKFCSTNPDTKIYEFAAGYVDESLPQTNSKKNNSLINKIL